MQYLFTIPANYVWFYHFVFSLPLDQSHFIHLHLEPISRFLNVNFCLPPSIKTAGRVPCLLFLKQKSSNNPDF